MKFRPCIDLHSGKVKQIVGSTLRDETKGQSPDVESLATNFETDRPASDFAHMYQRDGLTGGHVIMLGLGNDEAVRGHFCVFASIFFPTLMFLHYLYRRKLPWRLTLVDCKSVEGLRVIMPRVG
jgi:hypothetical protein